MVKSKSTLLRARAMLYQEVPLPVDLMKAIALRVFQVMNARLPEKYWPVKAWELNGDQALCLLDQYIHGKKKGVEAFNFFYAICFWGSQEQMLKDSFKHLTLKELQDYASLTKFSEMFAGPYEDRAFPNLSLALRLGDAMPDAQLKVALAQSNRVGVALGFEKPHIIWAAFCSTLQMETMRQWVQEIRSLPGRENFLVPSPASA
ncbi:MAG: hypothetical protein KGH79_04895 [Patescibacteria group bacterium]|nr:hypothetical protein [Patescibacteria group bacterium]